MTDAIAMFELGLQTLQMLAARYPHAGEDERQCKVGCDISVIDLTTIRLQCTVVWVSNIDGPHVRP